MYYLSEQYLYDNAESLCIVRNQGFLYLTKLNGDENFKGTVLLKIWIFTLPPLISDVLFPKWHNKVAFWLNFPCLQINNWVTSCDVCGPTQKGETTNLPTTRLPAIYDTLQKNELHISKVSPVNKSVTLFLVFCLNLELNSNYVPVSEMGLACFVCPTRSATQNKHNQIRILNKLVQSIESS